MFDDFTDACRNVYFSTNKTKNCLLKWSLRNKDKNVYGEKWVPATYLDTTKVDSPWEYRERSTIFWWTNERFYGNFLQHIHWLFYSFCIGIAYLFVK